MGNECSSQIDIAIIFVCFGVNFLRENLKYCKATIPYSTYVALSVFYNELWLKYKIICIKVEYWYTIPA